jgi:hypothetical protein
MRVLAPTILTMLSALTAIPVNAQTYGGNSPFCLEKWGWGGTHSINCSYSSMEQCHATASGLSAMCLMNPYYSNAVAPRRGSTSRQAIRGY